MPFQFRLRLLAPLCAAALAACGTAPPAPYEIAADRMGYLDQQFAPARVNPSVAAMVPAAPAPALAYERLVVTREGVAKTNDGKQRQWRSELTIAPARDGYFKLLDQTSGDDSEALYFTLSYQGLATLRTQLVIPRAPGAPRIVEVKTAKRFDRFPAAQGQDWTAETASGSEQMAAGLQESLKVCKAVKTGAAQELHPAIRGQAVELDCEVSSPRATAEHLRYTYLSDYGVAVQLGYTGAVLTTEYKITGFKVQ